MPYITFPGLHAGTIPWYFLPATAKSAAGRINSSENKGTRDASFFVFVPMCTHFSGSGSVSALPSV